MVAPKTPDDPAPLVSRQVEGLNPYELFDLYFVEKNDIEWPTADTLLRKQNIRLFSQNPES